MNMKKIKILNFYKKYTLGFTLAEVMIVLVIIGVIAAISIRSINIVNTQQQGFNTKAEKNSIRYRTNNYNDDT